MHLHLRWISLVVNLSPLHCFLLMALARRRRLRAARALGLELLGALGLKPRGAFAPVQKPQRRRLQLAQKNSSHARHRRSPAVTGRGQSLVDRNRWWWLELAQRGDLQLDWWCCLLWGTGTTAKSATRAAYLWVVACFDCWLCGRCDSVVCSSFCTSEERARNILTVCDSYRLRKCGVGGTNC